MGRRETDLGQSSSSMLSWAAGFGETDLALFVFNAGEGAFHWVGCLSADACSGWVFDCGTRSGAKVLKRSIGMFQEAVRRPPAAVILSHYHHDHYSHFKELGKAFARRNITVPEVWVPRIDPYSMGLYLRMLAFGALFRPQPRGVLPDRSLSKVFRNRARLNPELEAWFPNATIKEVGEGYRGGCPHRVAGIDVTILTPPNGPTGDGHPLSEPVGRIRAVLRDDDMKRRVRETAEEILRPYRQRDEFREYLRREEIDPQSMLRFGELVADTLGDRPTTERPSRERGLDALRVLLWLDVEEPVRSDRRMPLHAVPEQDRRWVGRWPNAVSDATHLFNVSATFAAIDGARFLLTGDSHVCLWPKIIEKTGSGHFNAVQVPHHGSEENVAWEAYAALDAQRYVVSAGHYKRWCHPSRRLAHAIREATPPGRPRCLYCTNRHANCEIGGHAPEWCPTDLAALCFSSREPTQLTGASLDPATPCGYVGRE